MTKMLRRVGVMHAPLAPQVRAGIVVSAGATVSARFRPFKANACSLEKSPVCSHDRGRISNETESSYRNDKSKLRCRFRFGTEILEAHFIEYQRIRLRR
jgi:hypothetical protein